VLKECWEIEPERCRRVLWLPDQGACHDLGPLVLRPPALHNPRVGIDDPILSYAFALIEAALYLAVGARGLWRKDLDGDE